MFLKNSRYAGLKTVRAKARDGREVEAVTLRRLADPPAVIAQTVRGHDALDVMAGHQYGDGTMFWHVADANTELEANDLTKPRPNDKETREVFVPET